MVEGGRVELGSEEEDGASKTEESEEGEKERYGGFGQNCDYGTRFAG